MGLVVKSSFSAGELNPALRERTTLEKYRDGLATARNVVVSKTGSLLSRCGRRNFVQTKLANRKVKLYSPPSSGYLIEWGHLYVRIYTMVQVGVIPAGTLVADVSHALTETDLPLIHFETSKTFVYVCVQGKQILKLNYLTGAFASGIDYFSIPAAPDNGVVAPAGAPTGYYIDYAVTIVKNGEESLPLLIPGANTYKMPFAASQDNVVSARMASTGVDSTITEMRLYRRPQSTGAFGYIGSTSAFSLSGSDYIGAFTDLGQDADYSHGPPQQVTNSVASGSWVPKTAAIYQQRLIINDSGDLEGLLASRPGFQNDFYQNLPIDSGSALKFKSGSSGFAQVLRMIDSDGLIVFTTTGVFLHAGSLTPDNLSIVKKGKWVIDPSVPPLAVPGGVFFVDVTTNSLRSLEWDLYLNKFNGVNLTTYSDHLFYQKVVTSMAFHEGALPLLWVTFDDGTFAAFTYEYDEQMRAWTRHDSIGINVEQVCATGIADTTAFLVAKGTTRYIELTNARYVKKSQLLSDTEYDMSNVIAAMDSLVTQNGKLNGNLVGPDVFRLWPVTNGVWDGDLNLTCGSSGVFLNQVPSPSTPGDVIRFFDPSDGSTIDLVVKTYVNANQLVVTPTIEFPSDYAIGPNLYWAKSTVTGLGHMEGESVAIVSDGYVLGSPNNDSDNIDFVTVSNGSITLPQGRRGAIVHVGRPITFDSETLDIDTVEQAPTLVESVNVNKVYVKVYNSRGLYVGNRFPDNDKVDGMTDLESYVVDYSQDYPIIGNRYWAQKTARAEVVLPGDWSSHGRVCIRQVDPLHFEILSIIPDVEVLTRSDR